MKTADQMMLELQTVFEKLKTGEMEHKVAAELHNGVGKMIALTRAQLEYHTLRKESPSMQFFGSNAPQGS